MELPSKEAKFIIDEFIRRQEIHGNRKSLDLKEYCTLPDGQFFDKQYQFVTDQDRFKTFDKSRRAGGTMGLAGLLCHFASTIPDINLAYVTLDRGTAERIIWNELLKINRDHDLYAKPNQQKLWITFPNGSMVYLAGIKDRNELNKLRGKAYYLAAIDECQSFRESLMKELIDDVLEASLIDYGGRLILVGTPNAACAGYFYEACRSDAWKHFHWIMDDNPWISFKSGMGVEEIRRQHLERKGITADDPTYRREWCGEWVRDEHALTFKYLEGRNDYAQLPDDQEWRYVLGADIGWHDADAICIWAFSRDLPNLYLVHAESGSHQDITQFADRIKDLNARYGSFVSQVIDTGGLGKKVTEELRNRHKINFEAADKTQKHAFIKLMNADFLSGLIKAKKGLSVVEDWRINQWNTDKDPPIEDERFNWDMCDAALYAWREAKHWAYRPESPKPKEGTKAWVDDEWKKLAAGDIRQQQEDGEWWENM